MTAALCHVPFEIPVTVDNSGLMISWDASISMELKSSKDAASAGAGSADAGSAAGSAAVKWSNILEATASFHLENVTQVKGSTTTTAYCAKLSAATVIENQEEEDDKNNDDIVTYSPLVSRISIINTTMPSLIPTALLSISLSLERILDTKENQNDDDNHNNIEMQPLLLSCLKAQLAGAVLLWDDDENGNVNSVVRVSMFNRIYVLRTESVLVLSSSSSSSSSLRNRANTYNMLYRILPSTKITINNNTLATSMTLKQQGQEQSLQQSKPPPVIISCVAKYLMDTLQCLQQQQPEADLSSLSSRVPDDCMIRFILLTGPPGTGKTFSVKTAVEALGNAGNYNRGKSKSIPLVALQGSQIMATAGGHAGEATRELTKSFRRAYHEDRPTLIFLDEFDALVNSESMAAALASLMDEISMSSSGKKGHNKGRLVMLVAATNRVDVIPAPLRRRFDHEIVMSPPRAEERLEILSHLLQQAVATVDMPTTSELLELARDCVGCVPSDLAAIVRKASLMHIQDHTVLLIDQLQHASKIVGASALRDAAMQAPPKTGWDDIAGDAGGAKKALQQAIEWPRTRKAAFDALGLIPPRGILLHGMPGCGKTKLARAAAGAAGVAFVKLDPADVYASSFVGDAEAVIRRAFLLARAAAPCILFFDEIDAIIGSTSDSSGNMNMARGSSAEARVLSTFLNEMDGVDHSPTDGVLVLGATNRPWTLDAALLRPGRLDKIIYVPPPDRQARRQLLERQTQGWPVSENNNDGSGSSSSSSSVLDLDRLVDLSKRMTGAEIEGACRDAARKALRARKGNESFSMKISDLEEAFLQLNPLIKDDNVLEEYRQFEQSHKR